MTTTDNKANINPYQYHEHLFGRESDARILINKIIAHRLTLLFSPSGMGKTVFLKEAVIPELSSPIQKNLTVIYHDDWISSPLDELKLKIKTHIHNEVSWSEEEVQGISSSSSLIDFLRFYTLFVRCPLIIILDQFENLFHSNNKISKQDIAAFIEQLILVSTATDLPVRLVISMKEDSVLELNLFTLMLNRTKPNLPLILFDNYYRLQGITMQAARDAIVIPIQKSGFHYESGLPEQIINDLLNHDINHSTIAFDEENTERVDPSYLQVICAQLWFVEANTTDKTLHLSTYRGVGGLEYLLQKHVQSTLEKLSTNEKKVAIDIFDHLISRQGSRISHTLDGLVELLDIEESKLLKILTRLVNLRIIRYQQTGDKSWYTLFHDTLITSIREWEIGYKQSPSNQIQSIHHESQED